MVKSVVPDAAGAPAVTVSVELPPAVIVEDGEKREVTLAGSPVTESATDSAAPRTTAVCTEYVTPAPPGVELRLKGVTETEKSGACTVTDASMPCVLLVAVPVMVNGAVPRVAAAEEVSVKVDPEPALTDGGVKEAGTPVGSALVERATLSALPKRSAVVTL